MEGGPVVLLGQGEQYSDPDDWRELIRTRRIRRGVELPVRRDGLTTLRRPEDVPELAAVLDAVDPPGLPSPAAAPTPRPPAPRSQAAPIPPRTGAPPSPSPATTRGPRSPPPPPGAPGPTPPRRSFLGVWWWLIALALLLLLRLCAPDGFGSLPSFGARADEGKESAPDAKGRSECGRVHGWIARAACETPAFARVRPVLAQAYPTRVAWLPPSDRPALAEEQARWAAGRAACRTDAAPGACLARRYRARIAELQTPLPGPEPTPGAAPERLALVTRPDWLRRPDEDQVADAYPERALRLDIDGRALLSCRATASGGLTACDIVSEDPSDYGFGAAALRLSRFYQLRARTADGRSVDGAKVDVPVAFRGG